MSVFRADRYAYSKTPPRVTRAARSRFGQAGQDQAAWRFRLGLFAGLAALGVGLATSASLRAWAPTP